MATATGFDSLAQFPSAEFDAYLAAKLLTSEQLARLSGSQLATLRAKVRSEILTSPAILEQLRRVIEQTVSGGSGAPPKS